MVPRKSHLVNTLEFIKHTRYHTTTQGLIL